MKGSYQVKNTFRWSLDSNITLELTMWHKVKKMKNVWRVLFCALDSLNLCVHTHTLCCTCAVISQFQCVRDYKQTFGLSSLTGVALPSPCLSKHILFSLACFFKTFALNFLAAAFDRMLLLGASKGRSKWTGNYVYGQFEVTSLHIGWSFK